MPDFQKYARQTALEDFGADGQRRLSAAKVALVGAGGVGSGALPILAGAGVGVLAIFDPDAVSAHNLHRQTIYRFADIGKPKASLAAEYAAALNPDVRVLHFEEKFCDSCAEKIAGFDFCIDATDSYSSRLCAARVFRANSMRGVCASAGGYVAQNFLFGNGLYFDDIVSPSESEGAAGLPIFPGAAHLSGVLAASAVVRAAASGKFRAGTLSAFDISSGKFSSFELAGGA